MRLWIKDVSKRDAHLLINWLNANTKYYYFRQREGKTILRHGRRCQLWSVYRQE